MQGFSVGAFSSAAMPSSQFALAHVAALAGLPPLRKDPFDRVLVAQAMAEGVTLLTGDPATYPGPIRLL
jgi:PIN domain nuclease of toxin-antitoxin system